MQKNLITELKTEKRGITSIALLITIVVLLILAATSIAMLTGDDGIITNAKIITLPNSVTHIWQHAFFTNVKYEKIKIGKNVSYILPIFKYNNYNGMIEIDKENNYYTIEDNILYSKDKKTLICALNKINSIIKIDSNVETIGKHAFYNQSQMPEVVIPKSVKSIDIGAFGYCTNLKSIEIPESITNLGNDVFSACRNLNEIRIYKQKNLLSGEPWGAPKGIKVVKWMK